MGLVHACARFERRARRTSRRQAPASLGVDPAPSRSARSSATHRRGRRSQRRPRCHRQRHVLQAQPAQSVTLKLAPSIATRGGLALQGRLAALRAGRQVTATGAPLDEQTNCLATAVYFEARGESARRPARRCPRGDEPRRVGQLSGRLVQRRQAAGAILLRPPRPVPGGRHAVGRVAQGRRASPGSRSPMSCRASAPTCCGTTPIMSRRRGAAA